MEKTKQNNIKSFGLGHRIILGFMMIGILFLSNAIFSIAVMDSMEAQIQHQTGADKALSESFVPNAIKRAKSLMTVLTGMGIFLTAMTAFLLSRSIKMPLEQILEDLKEVRKSSSSESLPQIHLLDGCIQNLSNMLFGHRKNIN